MNIQIEDNIVFQIENLSEIMENSDYTGIRCNLIAQMEEAKIPFKIDISTGDAITPREIKYPYPSMFETRKIALMSYPIEIVLAEKLETILSRNFTNTRMRDYYDVHVLLKTQVIDFQILQKALERTSQKRGSIDVIKNAKEIIPQLLIDKTLKKHWENYSQKFPYAKDYPWEKVHQSLEKIFISLENIPHMY